MVPSANSQSSKSLPFGEVVLSLGTREPRVGAPYSGVGEGSPEGATSEQALQLPKQLIQQRAPLQQPRS